MPIKKIVFVPFSLVIILLLLSASIERSSSGAPSSHTGAPDEKTCATVGCHDDNMVNSGTAKLSLSVDDDLSSIVPGQTYSIKIKITDKAIKRFGFQLLALNASTNENSGTFLLFDSLRTQIVQNRYALKERRYVTYTFNGTDAVSVGSGEWVVKWTAPKDLDAAVTFYLGGVSANDDMSDKGDHSYTKSFILKNTKF